MAHPNSDYHGGPALRMPAAAAAALACPVCGTGLHPGARGLTCESGHSFNVAREGYASLLTGATPPGTGDDKQMVADRIRFQNAGHYDPIGRALAHALDRALEASEPLVVDAGGGTGHYLARVLDAMPGARGITADVSKFAARKAAKAHPRGGAVTADTWRRLPLRDGSADALLNVFAPRNAAEFHRVLRADGVLAVVTPAADHLGELRGPLGLLEVDPDKDARLADGLSRHFTPSLTRDLRIAMSLTRDDAATAVGMGPSARHIAPGDLRDRVAALPDPVQVTAAVRLHVHHRSG